MWPKYYVYKTEFFITYSEIRKLICHMLRPTFWPGNHTDSFLAVATHINIVINSNYGPILHRFWDTATYWLKVAYFSYPSLIWRPGSLCSLWNFAAKLTMRKLESWGYPPVKTTMIVAGVVLTQCQRLTDGQTDRRRDRRTDGRIYDS